MTRSGILAAAAILASALASPAMAQQVIYNPGYCAQFYPSANCQNRGPGSPYYGGSYQRQAYRDRQAYQDRAWRNSYNRWDDSSGFWPGDVAAGVVGGAVGTAAACHLPDRRRRIRPTQRFCLHPRHLVPRRGRPAASLPVGRLRIAFGKGGWKARLFPCGSDESGSLGSGPLRPSLIFEPPKIGPSGGISPLADRFNSPV